MGLGTKRSIGPYEILDELGHGAMARVWRGWDQNLEREVAIKEPMFDRGYSDSVLAEMGRRFVAEGKAAARLNHPGIVTIYAADVWDGTPAIIMELVQGTTLDKVLQLGPQSPSYALSIIDQLLDAVNYAHQMGVVHRDIKPENIFVTPTGGIKLTDFGIAHLKGSMGTVGTVAGAVLGTPGYMSPEQAVGAPVDNRSDLFSVGVIAYELLTGVNPFGAGNGTDATTLIYRIVHEPVAELPDIVCTGLAADPRPAIMSALCKQPEGRPASAADFKAMLHGLMPVTPYQPYGQQGAYTYQRDGYQTGSYPSSYTGSGFGGVAGYGTGPGYGQGSFGAGSFDATSQSKTPSWLPYVLIGSLCTLVVLFLFISATSGSGFSSGGGSATSVSNTVDSDTSDSPQNDSGNSKKNKDSGSNSNENNKETESTTEPKPDVAGPVIDPDVAGPDDYVLADTPYHRYTYDEANALTNKQLYFARNEIYARYHRGFYDPMLSSYFNSKSWYSMELTGPEWNERYGAYASGSPCNDIEKANWELFLSIEEERDSELLNGYVH